MCKICSTLLTLFTNFLFAKQWIIFSFREKIFAEQNRNNLQVNFFKRKKNPRQFTQFDGFCWLSWLSQPQTYTIRIPEFVVWLSEKELKLWDDSQKPMKSFCKQSPLDVIYLSCKFHKCSYKTSIETRNVGRLWIKKICMKTITYSLKIETEVMQQQTKLLAFRWHLLLCAMSIDVQETKIGKVNKVIPILKHWCYL